MTSGTATDLGPLAATDASDEAEIRPSMFCLLLSFLKLGASAFGGPSMVAYIGKMAVEKKRWMSKESFFDGVALCQLIPGATAMQTSAYVGLKTRGIMGAAVSFIGFGFPAFLLMMILSVLYARAHSLPAVVSAFSGLQAIIVAIVANAVLLFGRNALKNLRDVIIAHQATNVSVESQEHVRTLLGKGQGRGRTDAMVRSRDEYCLAVKACVNHLVTSPLVVQRPTARRLHTGVRVPPTLS